MCQVEWRNASLQLELDWECLCPTSTLYLDCPVINDAGTVLSGWVRVTDRHPSFPVCCTLESVYRSGSSVFHWSYGPRCSLSSYTTVQHLPFGGVSHNDYSHNYYSCSIPPTSNGSKSYIHTYEVIEDD